MYQGEFIRIKRGRAPLLAISEFKVKLSNKFDLLMDVDKSEISDEVIILESIYNNINGKSLNSRQGHLSKEKQRKLSVSDTVPNSKDPNAVNDDDQWSMVKKKNKVKSMKQSRKKVFTLKKDLIHFTTPNPYKVLEDSDEEILPILIAKIKNKQIETKQIKSKQIRKRFLKKCRYCHFKKRSCSLNPSSCEAQSKNCFKCGKRGHFPQSLNCKAKVESQKSKKAKSQEKRKSSRVSKVNLDLVKERIIILELPVFVNQDKVQEQISVETIPFLTLFLLLNYDCITSSWKKPKQTSGHCPLKSADYCAKKFINSDKIDPDYFVKYCIKKAKGIIKGEPIPNEEDKADMKRIITVYDQMYYNRVEETEDQESQGKNSNHTRKEQLNKSERSEGQDQIQQDQGYIFEERLIPQLDGGIDIESSCDEEIADHCDEQLDGEMDLVCTSDEEIADQCGQQSDGEMDLVSSSDEEIMDHCDQQLDEEMDLPCCSDGEIEDEVMMVNKLIPQFDGGIDLVSSSDEEIIEKQLFAVNCEMQEVSNLTNFLRSFNFVWSLLHDHQLCIPDQKKPELNCFFCHMRSSLLRLNTKRSKGPKSLKLVEFVSQLVHYQSLDWNWRTDGVDLGGFLGNTLRLLRRSENKVSCLLGIPEGHCQKCQKVVQIKQKYIYQVETKEVTSESKIVTIQDILKNVILASVDQKCCFLSLKLENKQKKCVVFQFSHATEVQILSEETVWGRRVNIMKNQQMTI